MELLILLIVGLISVLILGYLMFGKKKGQQYVEMSETGIYVVDGNEIRPLNELPGNGSINDISESLGLTIDQRHTIHTFNSKSIEFIVFDKKTLTPIFLSARDTTKVISYMDVSHEIKHIDWGFERQNSM